MEQQAEWAKKVAVEAREAAAPKTTSLVAQIRARAEQAATSSAEVTLIEILPSVLR
jgi:hypothetical protein